MVRTTRGENTFLDMMEVYRPRRELQKAAPRNFDAFFEPVCFEKQKKTVETPVAAVKVTEDGGSVQPVRGSVAPIDVAARRRFPAHA